MAGIITVKLLAWAKTTWAWTKQCETLAQLERRILCLLKIVDWVFSWRSVRTDQHHAQNIMTAASRQIHGSKANLQQLASAFALPRQL
jgi:hypothetical protein